jgi:dihydropyrimidinase
MKEIKKVNGMLGVHCENGDLVDELIQSYVSQGKLTPHYHQAIYILKEVIPAAIIS